MADGGLGKQPGRSREADHEDGEVMEPMELIEEATSD